MAIVVNSHKIKALVKNLTSEEENLDTIIYSLSVYLSNLEYASGNTVNSAREELRHSLDRLKSEKSKLTWYKKEVSDYANSQFSRVVPLVEDINIKVSVNPIINWHNNLINHEVQRPSLMGKFQTHCSLATNNNIKSNPHLDKSQVDIMEGLIYEFDALRKQILDMSDSYHSQNLSNVQPFVEYDTSNWNKTNTNADDVKINNRYLDIAKEDYFSKSEINTIKGVQKEKKEHNQATETLNVMNEFTKEFKRAIEPVDKLLVINKFLLKKSDFEKYGEAGEKFFATLESFKDATKLKNVKIINNLYKEIDQIRSFTDNIEKGYKFIANPVKSTVKSILKNSKVLTPITKVLGKFGKVVSRGVPIVTVGMAVYDSVAAYYSDDKLTKGNVAHSVVRGALNIVKDAGPLELAMMFNSAGGPIGGVIGLLAGSVNAIAGTFWKDQKDWVYKNIEKGIDGAIDGIGNAATGAWNTVSSWFGGGK